MKICNIITQIKTLYKGESYLGNSFDEKKTRDKILFGSEFREDECTGIVTTCWASIDVIQKAITEKANLIIVHEALFWNHGDKTDWLANNPIFEEKKALLERHRIVVWRNHDYVHSGLKCQDGQYVDGIFYGLVKKLGWENNLNLKISFCFDIPKTTLGKLCQELLEKLHLSGLKYVGRLDTIISRVGIGLHALGQDNHLITKVTEENLDALLLLEMVEFTVAEHIFDSQFTKTPKTIISIGHFNAEEPGMEYMAEYLKENLNVNCPITFISAGEMVGYFKNSEYSNKKR